MKGIDRLYAGDYNVCSQAWQDDGTCVVTLFRHGDEQAVSMHIDELHGPKELVLVEVDIDMSPAAHILARQNAAARASSKNA